MQSPKQPYEFESSVNIQSLLIFLAAISVGTLVATILLPAWLPGLNWSLSGNSPKAYWYLSRGTGFASLSLLWVSMALGMGITNKMARTWPGAAAAFAIHEYVSLLGLAFAGMHGLVLLGDRYMNFSLAQIYTPFATLAYRPQWVGLGQIAFYAWLVLALSFYIRPLIGQKTWRLLHYLNFVLYVLALVHGLYSGTDTTMPWAQSFYWWTGGSLLFMFMGRVVGVVIEKLFPARPRAAAQR